MPIQGFVLGVDAGGTKTLAAVADASGTVRGLGRAGSANFQACGVGGAAGQIRLAVEAAAGQAGVALDGFRAVCYGVSGADRDLDFETVRGFVSQITPCPILRLENDTIIALRAGTPNGVGIALIAGTGSNAIGRTAQGIKLQVGGLGRLSGDHGSAGQLAEAAIVAAFWGLDGRGPPTQLSRWIPAELGLGELEDIIEFEFFEQPRGPLIVGRLAPLVFEAAGKGDAVARGILVEAGTQIARAVEVLLDKLFPEVTQVQVVFGGSVFSRPACPLLIDTVTERTRAHRADTRFVVLDAQPVVGALYFSFDALHWSLADPIKQRLRQGLLQADSPQGDRFDPGASGS